ncbi:hypothetical protein SK128_021731, partial [Halocaridina rubra]
VGNARDTDSSGLWFESLHGLRIERAFFQSNGHTAKTKVIFNETVSNKVLA